MLDSAPRLVQGGKVHPLFGPFLDQWDCPLPLPSLGGSHTLSQLKKFQKLVIFSRVKWCFWKQVNLQPFYDFGLLFDPNWIFLSGERSGLMSRARISVGSASRLEIWILDLALGFTKQNWVEKQGGACACAQAPELKYDAWNMMLEIDSWARSQAFESEIWVWIHILVSKSNLNSRAVF